MDGHPEHHRGPRFSPEHIEILITIERVGAGCSMVAIFLVLLTFGLFKKLRTTPNLFLIFASIANAAASVASMIGYDGLERGEGSHLCQAQAFIFEWFMQSDPWWSLAMAINVFLVFFCNADPRMFRKYAWLYCVICFGGPFIPAVVLISIRKSPEGLIFGDATLWCWIGTDWSLVRLYAYYIPIWIFSFLSIMIYIAVGYHVFHTRNQIRHMVMDVIGNAEKNDHIPYSSSEHRGSSEAVAFPHSISEESEADFCSQSFAARQDFYGTAVTEVQITREEPRQITNQEPALPTPTLAAPPRIQSWVLPGSFEHLEPSTSGRDQRFETVCTSDSSRRAPSSIMTKLRSIKSNASLKLRRFDPVKMAYLRTSFIFGLAVLITWIPSSANRLYSLTHHDRISFPLSVASGCVLPLQGVWNAVIYFTTSWKTFDDEIRVLRVKWFGRPDECTNGVRLNSRLGSSKGRYRNTFERTRQLRACSVEDAEK
ncbi:cyclic AMP receptor A [Fusarium beomiforme]|uniref:Cyclic AMP receptor A n=1 Tax=Fusarium beomiforme TaxID=44412 RepID=A0A9P5AQJ9_9HYPO|nr:cyclic AMP receptor A [Fusarium beomiforme]